MILQTGLSRLRRVRSPIRLVLPISLLCACCGCQGLARIAYRAGTHTRPSVGAAHVILAADFGNQPSQQVQSTPQTNDPDDAQSAQDQGGRDDEPRAAGETDDEAARVGADADNEPQTPPTPRAYTAPPAEVRQVALAQSGSATDDEKEDSTSFGDAGREAAEATVGSAASFVGQPGLSASQPTVAGVVVSRPGLQEGPASGLGFASPFNVLTPQTNPLSGVNGRCADLIHAGFFGGSQSACEVHFRRP